MNEKYYMELAIEYAKKAASLNEVPVAAVLVNESSQEVLSLRHNEIVLKNNPLNHAEILVIKEACKIKKGSGEPNKEKVGDISQSQLEEIAKIKFPDLNTKDLSSAVEMIKGTARSMGVVVKG